MIGAVVRQDIVENVIVIKEENVAAMAAALQCEIVDARPYGLTIGDLRTARGWTRNAGGEQMLLPELEQEQYDSYSVQQKRIGELENAVTAANEAADAAATGAVAETLELLGLE